MASALVPVIYRPSLQTSRPFTNTGRARNFIVRAEPINPSIDKDNPKVVNTVNTSEIEKQTAYCRCWRSSTFPLCNGSHVKYNKETGDNVGPLIVKKDA